MRKYTNLLLGFSLITLFFAAPAFAELQAVSESVFVNTSVSVEVASDIMTDFSPTSMRFFLTCTADQKAAPSDTVCPKVGYFQYVTTQTSKTAGGTTFTANISRGSAGALPAAGWVAEISKTTTTNGKESTYTNQVNISSMRGNPAVKMGASTGSGSAGGYRLFKSLVCTDQPLTCLTQAVFKFAQTAILLLAIAVMVIAGIIYMTSAGSPKQIAMSKKLVLGALTGVAVMVLGRLFLTKVVGVAWPWL